MMKKLSYKYYNKRITNRDNGNVQSHDKEEGKLNSTITANSGAHTPILSAINTPTYKLAKFLVPILKSLTSNEYTVKESFAFAGKLLNKSLNFIWEA